MLITPIKPNTFPHSAMPANIRGEYPNKVKNEIGFNIQITFIDIFCNEESKKSS